MNRRCCSNTTVTKSLVSGVLLQVILHRRGQILRITLRQVKSILFCVIQVKSARVPSSREGPALIVTAQPSGLLFGVAFGYRGFELVERPVFPQAIMHDVLLGWWRHATDGWVAVEVCREGIALAG